MDMNDMQDIRAIMEEPPGGGNFGRRRRVMDDGTDASTGTVRWEPLDINDMVGRDAIFTGGFSITVPGHGGTKGNPGGNTIHPDEYVDEDVLHDMAMKELGFSDEDLALCYVRGTGKKPPEVVALREAMDARFLQLYREGTHIGHLSEAIGLSRSSIERAIKRAIEREG